SRSRRRTAYVPPFIAESAGRALMSTLMAGGGVGAVGEGATEAAGDGPVGPAAGAAGDAAGAAGGGALGGAPAARGAAASGRTRAKITDT
ncbi:MAG: hypothetical protein FWD17_16665, partial [Polyangiaceae bacterium]|nr:hypothetical protein [Polyangiaceae bacterium]